MAKKLPPRILFLHPEPGDLTIGCHDGRVRGRDQNCVHDLVNHTKICQEAKTLDIHIANVEHDHGKTTSSYIVLASRTR
jgi:hypothetical protein